MDLVDPDDESGRRRPAAGPGRPDPEGQVLEGPWGPLKAALAKEGIELAEGMVVVLRGTLDLYRPKGEIGFILAELDVTALLGRLAAQRAQLLQQARGRGTAAAQRRAARARGAAARRPGGQPGDRGLSRLPRAADRLGLRLPVQVVPVTGAGRRRPGAVARAVTALVPDRLRSRSSWCAAAEPKADLAAFESEVVARAIAHATKPVWTGIGHTGDESVADIVANRACITPTECGQQIVVRVGAVVEAACRPSRRRC